MEKRGRKTKGDQKRDKFLKIRLSLEELMLIKKTVACCRERMLLNIASEADTVIRAIELFRLMHGINEEPQKEEAGQQ